MSARDPHLPEEREATGRPDLLRDSRGAVLVEFVIAIVPILLTFFTFVQLSRVATARLVVKHSAIIGARAASVISNQHNNTPDAKNDGKADIKTAVQLALGTWYTKGSITNVDVVVTDQSSRSDYYGWVTVKVTATYHCNVPMGWTACGGKQTQLVETFRMPHQGAIYKVEE